MPPKAERRRYLPLVQAMGFDAVEVGVDEQASEAEARDLARELKDAGLAIGCVRAGGGLCNPLTAHANFDKLVRAVRYASWTGATVVNTALVTPPTHPGGPRRGRRGRAGSRGATRTAPSAR